MMMKNVYEISVLSSQFLEIKLGLSKNETKKKKKNCGLRGVRHHNI